MTVYQGWRLSHVPTNPAKERYVATCGDKTITSSTMLSLQRKVEAAIEEAFA